MGGVPKIENRSSGGVAPSKSCSSRDSRFLIYDLETQPKRNHKHLRPFDCFFLPSHSQDAYAQGPVRNPVQTTTQNTTIILIFIVASVPRNIVRFHLSLCQIANGPPSQYKSLPGGCPLICAMQVTFWNKKFCADRSPGKPISGRSNGQRPKMGIL